MELNDVQAVVQVLAESAGARLGFEIAIGGGDDSNIHAFRRRVADPGDDVLLERAQDLHLQGERHVADFV